MLIVVNPAKDNAAISREDLPQGTLLVVGGKKIVLVQAIRKGERVALTDLNAGAHVIQYGVPFAVAKGPPT